MRVALVRDGLVQNVIIADDEFVASIESQWHHLVQVDGLEPEPGIGWGYVDGEFTQPVEE